MSTLTHSANSFAAGSAVPDGVARLGLIDSFGARLANLTEAPQTIGSGPRCSVRLGGRGLRPLHCVITPGKNGPIVRRWAAETRLNGLEFTEAALSAGDLLRIGSIDLRVIELGFTQPPCETSDPESHADQGAAAGPLAAPSQDQSEAAEPIDSPLSNADWLDDSIDELLAAVDSANHAPPAADSDPPIPGRLMPSWAADASDALELDGPTEADVEVDAAVSAGDDPWEVGVIVPSHAESIDEAALSLLEEDQPSAAEAEESVAVLQQPGFAEESPADGADQAETNDDPWHSARMGLDEAADAKAAFDDLAAAVAADAAETSPDCLAEITEDSAIERYRVRAAARRTRVSALIAALRAERRQTADLTEAASGLASQLEEALVASDRAGVELARLADERAVERAEADDNRAAARQALDEATRRAEQLEAQVSELEAQVADLQDRAPALEAHVAELEATLAKLAKAPGPNDTATLLTEGFDPPVAGVIDNLVSAPSQAPEWVADDDADAVPVFTDEVLDDEVSDGAVEADPYVSDATEVSEGDISSWPTLPELEAAPIETEPLWGIERLAKEEAPTILDSLWKPVLSETVATEHPTKAPNEAADDAEIGPDASYDKRTAPEVGEESQTATEPVAASDENVDPAMEPVATVESASDIGDMPPMAGAEAWNADVQDNLAVAPKREPEPSFIERFASLLPEDDEPVEPPTPVAEAPAAAESHDEESIDDYMRRLMQRVRGSSTGPSASGGSSATLGSISETTGKKTLKQLLPTATEPVVVAKAEMLRDLSELRRTPSPEGKTDMGALRQLANQSARHAIDVAHSRQSREKATMRLAVSIVLLVAGALASIFAPSPLDLQFIGGFASVVIGGWFFVRTVRQCQTRTLDEQIALAEKHAG